MRSTETERMLRLRDVARLPAEVLVKRFEEDFGNLVTAAVADATRRLPAPVRRLLDWPRMASGLGRRAGLGRGGAAGLRRADDPARRPAAAARRGAAPPGARPPPRGPLRRRRLPPSGPRATGTGPAAHRPRHRPELAGQGPPRGVRGPLRRPRRGAGHPAAAPPHRLPGRLRLDRAGRRPGPPPGHGRARGDRPAGAARRHLPGRRRRRRPRAERPERPAPPPPGPAPLARGARPSSAS